MKATRIITIAALVLLIAAWPADAAKKDKCTTIKSGELYRTDGALILPGYDEWGYNYQARKYNGMYCDFHPAYRYPWCYDAWGDVHLAMKWNDAWLSNKDCDGDGKLDRHYGYDNYYGSGAWTTNHMRETYELDGKTCTWTYFVKIVAVPSTAILKQGVWYTWDGEEIGPVEWGAFARIQEVYNDPCGGYHGLAYKGFRPGLGAWGE